MVEKTNYGFLMDTFRLFLNKEHPEEAEEYESRWSKTGYLQPWNNEKGLEIPIMHHEVLYQFGCSIDWDGHHQFIKKIINPLKQLDFNELRALMDALNFYVGGNKEVRFQVTKTRHQKAIEWLWVDVDSLNFKGLQLFKNPNDNSSSVNSFELTDEFNDMEPYEQQQYVGKSDVFLPANQCYFCGRKQIDKEGTPFSKRKKRCHYRCPDKNDRNTGSHSVDCCAGNWERLKSAFIQKLKRAKTKNDKAKVFLNFLNERYQANLTKEWDIFSFSDAKTLDMINKHLTYSSE